MNPARVVADGHRAQARHSTGLQCIDQHLDSASGALKGDQAHRSRRPGGHEWERRCLDELQIEVAEANAAGLKRAVVGERPSDGKPKTVPAEREAGFRVRQRDPDMIKLVNEREFRRIRHRPTVFADPHSN